MTDQTKITAYKGFNLDFTCRDFQYEVGATYEHDGKVETCGSGFHACENPLDVFRYYGPAGARFAEVDLSGEVDAGDDKIAAAKITIVAEISLSDMIQRAVQRVIAGAKLVKGSMARGNRSAASTTGSRSAASATGNSSAASATGYSSAASATGNRSAASATGYNSAASATGDSSAASATGYRGTASATGDSSAASATGYRGTASATGDSSAASATGKHSVALAAGWRSMALAGKGCALFLVERSGDDKIVSVFAGIAGQGDVKPDTWYILKDGLLREAQE